MARLGRDWVCASAARGHTRLPPALRPPLASRHAAPPLQALASGPAAAAGREEKVDVVIVGAGVSGLMAARTLEGAGHKVRPGGNDGGSTYAPGRSTRARQLPCHRVLLAQLQLRLAVPMLLFLGRRWWCCRRRTEWAGACSVQSWAQGTGRHGWTWGANGWAQTTPGCKPW